MTTYATTNHYTHISAQHVLKRAREPPARGDPVYPGEQHYIEHKNQQIEIRRSRNKNGYNSTTERTISTSASTLRNPGLELPWTRFCR